MTFQTRAPNQSSKGQLVRWKGHEQGIPNRRSNQPHTHTEVRDGALRSKSSSAELPFCPLNKRSSFSDV